MSDPRYQIDVSVVTRFLADQSQPEHNRFAFAYTITVKNNGLVPAKLLTWLLKVGRLPVLPFPAGILFQAVSQPDIAEAYWQIHRQDRSAWTHELDLRPFREPF